MLVVADELTRRGEIVLIPLVRQSDKGQSAHLPAVHVLHDRTPGRDQSHPISDSDLDRMHRDKIEMSTSIVVVSDGTGYYGDSTRARSSTQRASALACATPASSASSIAT